MCGATAKLLISFSAAAATPNVDPNEYPRMTDKEIGHIRHIARLSRNPWGDWTGFDTVYNPLQGEKMFVISFMAYTLELAQHELTPAYHEIYRTSIENLLKKMQHPDVWYPWMFESRHGSVEAIKGEPLDWMTNPGWIDPILKTTFSSRPISSRLPLPIRCSTGTSGTNNLVRSHSSGPAE